MLGRYIKMLLWVWFLLPVLFIPHASAVQLYEQTIGAAKLSRGDNPLWSSPSFDDNSWQQVGKLNIREKMSLRGITWYRIHFHFPKQYMNEPAFLVNLPAGADEIFLNGVKIGGKGIIGDRFVSAPNVSRLYRIPAGALKSHGENLIAIRIMSMFFVRTDLADTLRIGEYQNLFLDKLNNDSHRIKIEILILALLFINLFLFVMNITAGTLERNTISFGFYIILAGSIYIMESFLFHETGLNNYVLQRVCFSMIALIPVTIPFLLVYLYSKKITLFLKAITATAILLGFVSLFFFNIRFYSLMPYIWSIIMLASVIESLRIAVYNWLRKAHESGIILAAVICAACAGILFSAAGISGAYPSFVQREFIWVLAGPGFMFLRIFAFVRMYARLSKSHARLSKKILEAQESERTRLARELHDSVGQSLLAVQLNLDIMGAQTDANKAIERETLSQLRSEITKTINEVRRVSTELRPSFFDRLDIAETIIHYGKNIEQTSGIKVIVNTAGTADVPQPVKHNIYRIFQEAMTNIMKHASATMVKVNFDNNGKTLFLEVIDNGKGFVDALVNESSTGLGISIMKERAELLGGTLIVKSAPGSGTSIIAEVPI